MDEWVQKKKTLLFDTGLGVPAECGQHALRGLQRLQEVERLWGGCTGVGGTPLLAKCVGAIASLPPDGI